MSIHRTTRRIGVVAASLSLVAAAAFAAPATAETSVGATFRCTAVDVTSSRHDLSNVVLRFADGDQKFDGVRGKTATLSGTGAFAGKPVVAVFIKAGDNASGEGPGYGQRIDATGDTCDNTQPAAAPVNDSSGRKHGGTQDDNPPKNDQKGGPRTDDRSGTGTTPSGRPGDGAVVNATFACGNTSVEVTSTKDLSNVVLRLSDGRDVKHVGLHGNSKTFVAPDGTTITAVFIKSGDNPSGEGPGYGQRVNAPAPTACVAANETAAPSATVTPAVTPEPVVTPPAAAVLAAVETRGAATVATPPAATAATPPAAAVLGVVHDSPAAVAKPAGPKAQVLGVSFDRPGAAPASANLARTGLNLLGLLLTAVALLAGGMTLLRRSRRAIA